MKKKWLLLPVIALGLVGCQNRATDGAQDADNSDQNIRDGNFDTATSEDQGEDENDLRITQEVRKALMRDSTLSTDAKNIKVITQGGVVTLRGTVANSNENDTVLRITGQVRGIKRVNNLLQIKSTL
jgi:hyperosmotically inducible protein